MLKKLPLSLLFAFFALASFGQTIVSTSPQNKNVVLEEFTGIHCTYCPDGHAIAKAIQDANPTRVSLINIHEGGYAVPGNGEPDFRTAFGTAIAGQSGLTGYPAGQINRHVFPGRGMSGGSTAMGRGSWNISANDILAAPSYVNLAATAHVDAETNVMTIHVEAYYTANSPESTNFLNVALVQNNTKGPQTGGGQGNNYNHMHRLINMLTGQWGEEITQTTSGTFVSRDYTYQIIPHNNLVPVEIGELEVVVFMTQTHQEIISGNRAIPTVSVANTNDIGVRYIEDIKTSCLGSEFAVAPKVNIQNTGSNPITSLNINYTVNGTSATHTWTGTLASLQSKTITLPATNVTILETNSISVSVPNDDYNANNEKVFAFDAAPSGGGTLTMVLNSDGYGNETRWRLKDGAGNILYTGGPYGNNQTYTEIFNLDTAGCYSFMMIDTYGDGGATVTLTDTNGIVVYQTDGNYGTMEESPFSSDGVLGVSQSLLENVNIYPNPALDILNISNAETADIKVYDMLGRTILSKGNISLNEQVNVSSLNAGTYFIKITKEGLTTTKKFIVAK